MRSFSNILPNFATNLHLLVDSIKCKKLPDICIFKYKYLAFRPVFRNFADCNIKL